VEADFKAPSVLGWGRESSGGGTADAVGVGEVERLIKDFVVAGNAEDALAGLLGKYFGEAQSSS
jgi:hypothetical protein